MLTPAVSVSRETQDRLEVFVAELLHWQKRLNLIGPATEAEVWQRHIADSWQLTRHMETARTVVDMGSGAGFPGIVLAIWLAENGGGRVALVESVGKKCSFLNSVRRKLELPVHTVVDVINQRVQECLPREQDTDLVTARAFASLTDLLSHSCLIPGHAQRRHLFPKGTGAQREVDEAHQAFHFEIKSYQSSLPGGGVILEVTDLNPN